MKRSALIGIPCLLLALAACRPEARSAAEEATTTPEVFIPLDKAIPEPGILLEGVQLQIASTTLSTEFPAGCTGAAPGCIRANEGTKMLAITFVPGDLPEGKMLAYKNLPAVSVALEGEAATLFSHTLYNNANHNLTLGFEVPAGARTFGLRWADLREIPLRVDAQ